ncbi:hemicentin-1-like [Silurus meridionalis]|nr:hemicentin-1-like [Silurus meridionalis]
MRQLQDKPNIIEPLDSTVTVSEGENLTLTCSAHGNPLPHYCWTLANSTTISNSSTIIIRSIHPEKQGQYTCTAYNHLGKHTKKVRVTVEVKVKGTELGSDNLF